jgi:hypothetical protein
VSRSRKFHVVDAIEALQEALALLKKKKHSLVGRVFRDVCESSEMVEYFLSGNLQSQNDLKKWFDNEIISHEKIRKHLKRNGRKAEAEERRQRQRELSKFTHRTYRAMLKGYSRGGDDKMVYDIVKHPSSFLNAGFVTAKTHIEFPKCSG